MCVFSLYVYIIKTKYGPIILKRVNVVLCKSSIREKRCILSLNGYFVQLYVNIFAVLITRFT